ncbi:hypothetical protein BHE74_00049834 [Ensete ventricosum]|nr:hypothetical protein BHE74_00049834 [Ensete ventricosum]
MAQWAPLFISICTPPLGHRTAHIGPRIRVTCGTHSLYFESLSRPVKRVRKWVTCCRVECEHRKRTSAPRGGGLPKTMTAACSAKQQTTVGSSYQQPRGGVASGGGNVSRVPKGSSK